MTEYLAFDGYDPDSQSLQRSPLVGTCLRSVIDAKFTCAIKDKALPVRSGDLVSMLCRNREGVAQWLVKELRCTRDGKWWAVCDDAVFQVGLLYRPSAIYRIVALSTQDFGMSDMRPPGATPKDLETLERRALPAVAEWKRDGYRKRVPFPGLHVVNIPDRSRADLPTKPDAPGNGLGDSLTTSRNAIAIRATVQTPSYDEPTTPTNFEARSMPEAIQFTWVAPAPRNNQTIYHLYEHTAITPFSSATRVWSGKTLSVLLERTGFTTAFYWLTAELNGIESAATPVGDGLSASPSLPGFTGILHDSFEHQDAERFYDARFGSFSGASYPTDGANGGRVFQLATGQVLAVWNKNIPYDPEKIYRMTVRFRRSVDGGSPERVVVGVEGYAADGTTLINRSGGTDPSTPHTVAYNDFLPSNDWIVARGYLSGHAASSPSAAAPDISAPNPAYGSGGTIVRYIRPFFWFNPSTATGTIQIDYIDLRIVDETGDLAPDVATEVESVEDDSVSLVNGGGVVISDFMTPLGLVEGYLLQVTATFDVWITDFGGGTPEFFINVLGNSGGLNVQSQSAFPSSTTSPGQRITLQVEVPVDLVDETTSLSTSVAWTGAAPAGTAEVRNAALRSEKIKR